MTRKGNKVVIVNTNDLELKVKLKNAIDLIYLQKGYKYKSDVIEKDILNWFNSIKDKSTLKHLHHVSKKTPIYTYGFEMNADMWALYTESFGKGIMQKIILNWFELTQKKINKNK